MTASGAHNRILVVDDERSMCDMLEADLGDAGFLVDTATTAVQALEFLAARDVEAVVTDINMPRLGGLEFCREALRRRPGVPVIAITAFGSMETAIEALRAGAYDFITKPFDTEVLARTLERAINHHALREEVRRLRHVARSTENFGDLLGESQPMMHLFGLLEKLAPSDASVLIRGETGTGKELVARGLHARSPRADNPFVALNCAAVPAQLLESELFGHVRGAFTDAKSDHRGLFEHANGGTLFLDEIGELPLELQPKLLRVLQERTVRPLGGTRDAPVDVRVLAATHRDLEQDVERGRFRQDLLYRINVIQVDIPPLRVRGNDVLLLAQRFLEKCSEESGRTVRGISHGAADCLMRYAWPGNVRELQNAIERAVTLAEHDKILEDDLPERVRTHRASHVLVDTGDASSFVALDEVERRYITRVFDAVGHNKAQAARILGVDRKTLYRKLRKYGLE